MMRSSAAIFRIITFPRQKINSYTLSSSFATEADIKTDEPDVVLMPSDRNKNKYQIGDVKSKLVADVFERLQNKNPEVSAPINKIRQKIRESNSLEQLLEIAKNPRLSRTNALEILSTLGDWTVRSEVKLSDFEADPRYVNMCKILGEGSKKNSDLSMVLKVTGDDEAAKLISSASLDQMLKILSQLSASQKRSPPLLSALAFNISKCNEKLSLKQCADVLFALAKLNYYDDALKVKIISDIELGLIDGVKSSVPASICHSLGTLRIRDPNLMNVLVNWFLRNEANTRPQDFVSIVMALAILNVKPSPQFFKVVMPKLQPINLLTPAMFLRAIWSLAILEVATPEQISFVLSPTFVEKLRLENSTSDSETFKLLNIDATAQYLVPQYHGYRLTLKHMPALHYGHSKVKASLVHCVMDTLCNLLPSADFLKKDIDTGAGFILDAECQFDKHCSPIPVHRDQPNSVRVAIQVLGYHDTTIGRRSEPVGLFSLRTRILEARGYRVLNILHSEFNTSLNLAQRVQVLEKKLKYIVSK